MSQNIKVLATQRKLSVITIVAVYLLILIGSVVRSTGSGMGCPDWPKCFGNWIPPTSIEQLPADYKEIYSEKRHQKNLRFASYLDVLGMDATSEKIKTDPSIREEADFNPLKTWIEYVNRLVGVLIGFLIILTFIHSLRLRKDKPIVFWFSLLALLGVIFQGWVGSIVVSTNLLPGLISFHMLLALLIMVFLICSYFFSTERANREVHKNGVKLKWMIAFCAVIFLIQMVVGIDVREAVDTGLAMGIERGSILDQIDFSFVFHRSFSWALLAGHLLVLYLLWKNADSNHLVRMAGIISLLVLLEVGTGAAMGYFAIPAFIQPIHLLTASLIFGCQVYLFLLVASPKESLNYRFE